MMDKDKINYERIKVFFNIYIIIYTKDNQESRPTVSIPRNQNIKWKIPLQVAIKKCFNLAINNKATGLPDLSRFF